MSGGAALERTSSRGPAEPAPPRRRIGGVDLARALAVVGMLAVHVGPTRLDDLAGRLYALPHGRASILLVLVAGVGVTLLAASRAHGVAAARWRLAWRSALLLPLGLLLQEIDHGVLVILPTHAGLLLLAILVLRLPDRALLALAGGAALIGPIAYLIGSTAYPEALARRAVGWSEPAGHIALGVLAGPYPLPMWVAPFLCGIWLGRRDLGSRRVGLALVAGGAATTVLAPAAAARLGALLGEAAATSPCGALLLAAPHSQMPPWLIGAIGSAALVLGCSLLAADALPRAVAPFVALGELALTFYVAHLLALHAWGPELRAREVAEAARTVAALTAAAALAASLWRRAARRGPLEALLDQPWRWTEGRGPSPGG